MLHYFATLSSSRLVLWCYLIWYLAVVTLHFDPSPLLWASSLGMRGIIGLALLVSTGKQVDRWRTFRLFLMPFCVSSYSALIKGKGFLLVFPPSWVENGIALGWLAVFLTMHGILKSTRLTRADA